MQTVYATESRQDTITNNGVFEKIEDVRRSPEKVIHLKYSGNPSDLEIVFPKLINLRKLSISYDSLYYLPETLNKCQDLEEIKLSGTKMIQVEKIVKTIRTIRKLKSLFISSFKNCDSIESINELKGLRELGLLYLKGINGGQIEIKLRDLEILHLSTTIINLSKTLSNMSNIKILTLDGNPHYFKNRRVFSTISQLTHLEQLGLSQCEISEFPVELLKMKSLRSINLINNKIRHVPLNELTENKNIRIFIRKNPINAQELKGYKENCADCGLIW